MPAQNYDLGCTAQVGYDLGHCNPGDGDGDGDNTIATEDEGAIVDPAASILDFRGNGVAASDAGGGRTTVTVTDTDTQSAVLQWGNGSTPASTIARYLVPGFDPSIARTLGGRIAISAPFTGVMSRLLVRHNQGGTSMAAMDYSVIIGFNGGPPVITPFLVSIPANVVGFGVDAVTTHPCVEGDLIYVSVDKQAAGGSGPSDVIATLEFFRDVSPP